MSSKSLDNSSSDNKIQEEEESVIIDTNCTFSKVLIPQIEEKFSTPTFYLHDSLEPFLIEITWAESAFTAQLIHVTHDKHECNFKPYFKESVIFDQTAQCNYNLEPQESNPSCSSCTILNYSEFNETRLLLFTFNIQHVRHYCENICPTKSELYERLNNIFMERRFTDVKINVKGKEFLIHKAMIIRCSILYEIIRNNPNKKNRNVIDITDVEPEVFEVLLKYLYLGETGTIELYKNNNDFLFNVILAADYYQIIDLKHKLINVAIKYLSIQNVIHNLIFAEKLNICNLKENCMKFIRIYGKSVSETMVFQELINKYPKLSADVLLFVLRE